MIEFRATSDRDPAWTVIRCRAATRSLASTFLRGLKPTAIVLDRSAVSRSDRRAVTHGSRGLQPTVRDSENILSHSDNGISPQQIALIHRQIMPRDKLPIFLLESRPGMVLPLAGDITDRVVHLRLPDRKRAVSILPCECSHRWPLLGNPLGRFTFEMSHPFAERDRGRQTYQEMDVIFHAADLKCLHLMRPANSTQVTPHALLDLRRDPAFAVLGGEYHMQADGGVGVGHLAGNVIRCRAATQSLASPFRVRGLKPTAIVLDRSAVSRSDRSAVTHGSRGLQPTVGGFEEYRVASRHRNRPSTRDS